VADVAPDGLRALVTRLETLATRRLKSPPRSDAAAGRSRQLVDHLAGHLRVRANSLDSPLLVLILGPTGAGKSTLFNTLAGRPASRTGVLRPTTRVAVVLVHPNDRGPLVEGTLRGVGLEQMQLVEDGTIAPGVAIVDAPDIDSIEHANRGLADQLVEAADLCLFVTTAARYADQVPWSVLARIRQRGLPLILVLNRMPPDEGDRSEVTRDVRRLLSEAGMEDSLASGERAGSTSLEADQSPLPMDEATGMALEVLGITEGDVEPVGESLRPAAIAPIARTVADLRADREARVALAARALVGSLAGLGELLDQVADDAEHEAIDVEALRRAMTHHFERSLDVLRSDVDRGTFLREEALQHWQRFVGADQVTRFFSQGIGRVRGAIAAILRPASAPVTEVRAATTDDLVAVARSQAAEAARLTAARWAEDLSLRDDIAADPTLWGTSTGFDARLRSRLDAWIEGIATDIAATGRPKRELARGASIGVNALGTGVMLATFIHTGGLTGAEVGVAAATAFLNQKLLAALFGEAAMAELIASARRRLHAALTQTFEEERERFDQLLSPAGQLTRLAADLREAVGDLGALPVRDPGR
jgi:energy-coupling factor transporter ATP-binding protein EcfA2